MNQILVAIVMSAGTLVFHATVMAGLAMHLKGRHDAIHAHAAFVRIVIIVVVSGGTLTIAHMVEVLAWGAVYWTIGMTANGDDAFYFAFVNYTTLGYGDLLPQPHWRMLGPVTAANGIMLFGLSTASLFQILLQSMIDGAGLTRPRA